MKRLLPLVLLLMPLPAFCLDMQFYTYDGFQETVDAFTRLALIFSDNAFLGFAATFAVFGVVCGAIMFGTKAHMGQASAPLAWTMPILFGMVVFKGLVIPTGTIYIYDQVLNANQAVGGVPDIIVFLAGGLNELEYDIVQVIDTASANPYGTTGGGMVSFNLVMSSAGAQPDDIDLGRSVQAYYKDCGVFAVNTGYNSASLQELMRGSPDLTETFAKFANPALSTTWFTSANEQGAPVGCDAAWTSINTAINSSSEMQSMENEICQKSGFNPTLAAELAQCDSDLSSIGQLFGVPAASSGAFMRSAFLAQSITSALQSGDFALGQSEIMNRQVMTESLGSADAMNEWIPKLRAFMTATVLGLIPLLALFMMTPLSMKALATVMGLFMWLFFWGIADATASVMMNDAATNAFAQITHYNLGFDAIINAPEGAIKALGIYGKARGMALGMATLLSSSLMAFGGVALSSLGRNLQQDYEGKGERAASTAMLPEQRGAFMNQMASGVAAEATVAGNGFMNTAAGASISQRMSAGQARESLVNPQLSGGRGLDGLIQESSQIQLGQMAGQNRAVAGAAASEGIGSLSSAAADKASNDGQYSYGETHGRVQGAGAAGMSQFEAGTMSGGVQGGRMGAYMEVYRNVNGTDKITGDGVMKVAQLFEGSHIAQSESTSNPRDYIENTRQAMDKQKAIGEFLHQHPGAAHQIGWDSEMNSLLQNKAFEQFLSEYGAKGVQEGMHFAGANQAARGVAATRLGGIPEVANKTAANDVSQAAANADVSRDVATAMGMDPNNIRNLEYLGEKRGGAQVSMTLDDGNREPIVKGLQASGQLDESRAKSIMDNRDTGKVNLVVGPGGRLLQGNIESGSSTSYRSMDTSQVGSDKLHVDSQQDVVRHSVTQDYSTSLAGGEAVVATKGATANFIRKGQDQWGNVGESYKTQVAAQYAASVAEYGHRANTDASRAYSSQIASQVGAQIGLEGKVGVVTPVGGAAATGGVSTSVSSTESRTDQHGFGVHSDAGTVFFRQVFDGAYEKGTKEAERVYGKDFQHGAHAADGNAYVANYTELKLQAAHDTLVRNLTGQQADTQGGLQDALHVSKDGKNERSFVERAKDFVEGVPAPVETK